MSELLPAKNQHYRRERQRNDLTCHVSPVLEGEMGSHCAKHDADDEYRAYCRGPTPQKQGNREELDNAYRDPEPYRITPDPECAGPSARLRKFREPLWSENEDEKKRRDPAPCNLCGRNH